ncbi:hypothetical protein [Pseudalkalibacillus decolorationis]|uniref:hypothetical protein n=1 Tax=Pseudalkalibacillus decolorationis TaxID=163879 RepID=UPI002148DFF5|nr:hypothetical protein [Pseudalkalibacillus decolorationis]
MVGIGWVIPIGFWLIGLLIAASPGFMFRFVEKEKAHLRKEADDRNFRDHLASITLNVEEDVLSMIPWWGFTLITSILAAFLFTFGFVALSFVIHP